MSLLARVRGIRQHSSVDVEISTGQLILAKKPSRTSEMCPNALSIAWKQNEDDSWVRVIRVSGSGINKDGEPSTQQRHIVLRLDDPEQATSLELSAKESPQWLIDVVNEVSPPCPGDAPATAQPAIPTENWDATKLLQPSYDDMLAQVVHLGVKPAIEDYRVRILEMALNSVTIANPQVQLSQVLTVFGRPADDKSTAPVDTQIRGIRDAYDLLGNLVFCGDFALNMETANAINETITGQAFTPEKSLSNLAQYSQFGAVEDLFTQAVQSVEAVEDPRLQALLLCASITRIGFYQEGNELTALLMAAGHLLSNGYASISVPPWKSSEYEMAIAVLNSEDNALPLIKLLANCIA